MKKGDYLAVPLVAVLAALPVLAGICDLRCASSRIAVPSSEAAAVETCPLHDSGETSSPPPQSAPAPCHSPRAGRGGDVLLTAGSPNALNLSDASPVFAALRLTPWSPDPAAAIPGARSGFSRSPRASPPGSVLRI